jgi:DNA repair protein RadC
MPMKETQGTYRITDLPVTDRPRERLAELGAQVLSNAELLAILLRVGVEGENAVQLGQRLLTEFGGLQGIHRTSPLELQKTRGIGEAKAAQLLAAIELGRRLNSLQPEDRPAVHSPKDAADLVMYEMSGLSQEHLWTILLDTRNRVLDIKRLYQGSLNSSNVRVAEVFREPIVRNAAALIVAHNHPSGDPSPSPEDVALTRALVETGKLLDIQVLDHIVVGGYRFVSLKEKRLGF